VPDGGSVDDMPIQQLGSLIAAAIRSAALAKPAFINKVSYASIKKALNEFCDSGPATFADVETGIADIAAEHKASPFDCKRIWDSIQEDRKASSEALSCKSAIMRRQELEARRKTIRLEDYLPEGICPAIRELTGNLACDDLMAVSVVLTTAAGSFRAGHRIDVGDGMFVKEPVLWLLVAGPSGSGKSPIMRHLCRDRLGSVMAHYSQISIAISQEWEMRYANVPKAKRPDKPRNLATCIGDFTTEELVRILGDNHEHGLATFVYSEEIKSILGNFDEYKSGGKGKGKETFLTLFDGNVEASHRVGRQSKTIVGKVQNALLGAVQPGVFRRMIEGGDDAGLFARCLVVPVQDRYIEPKFLRSPEEIIAVNMAEKGLDQLRLDPDAVELFNVLWKDNYEKVQAVALESQRAILGKRLGYILQAALAMHLCKVAAGEISEEQLFLSKQTLARAVVLVDILQNYAIVEQQESQMQRHGAFDLNRKIHLHSRASNGITAYEFLTRYVPLKDRKFMTTQHVAAAMEQLVEMKLGEFQVKGNGRQTKIFVATGKYPD
jgi:energy-coupling factor transporter ATP-binding protein EcfA2